VTAPAQGTARRSAPVAILVVLLVAACASPSAAPPTTQPPPAPTSAPSPPPTIAATAKPPSPTTTPSPTPLVELTPALLVDGLDPQVAEEHLATLQAIADRHGSRANGSPGYAQALAHVVGRLDALGYRVVLRPFSVDGVAGTSVIAERAGSGDEVVMLGAHLDGVAGSAGMNNNGSGVTALLVVAEALIGLPQPDRTVRLAFWDAKEGGPFGSRMYVESLAPTERERIVAYLNLDVVGSPNALRLVYEEADAPPGSDGITELFAAYFDALELPWEPVDLRGASDHGPFAAGGIPTGGLFSGGIQPVTQEQASRFGAVAGAPADPCTHAPCDTLGNVNRTALLEMTRAAAHVLAVLATSSSR
jgi:aminopeptidase S